MPLYRVDSMLDRNGEKIQIGTVSRLEWMSEDGRAVLVRLGKVHPMQTPPLDELNGWQARAKKLKTLDIETIDDFLEADTNDIRKVLRVSAETVKKYSAELERWGLINVIPQRG